MSLIRECEKHLKDLEDLGIKYPNPVYMRAKMIKTTIEASVNAWSGVGDILPTLKHGDSNGI